MLQQCKERGDRARLEYVRLSLVDLRLTIKFPRRHLKANAPTTLIQREIDDVIKSTPVKSGGGFFG